MMYFNSLYETRKINWWYFSRYWVLLRNLKKNHPNETNSVLCSILYLFPALTVTCDESHMTEVRHLYCTVLYMCGVVFSCKNYRIHDSHVFNISFVKHCIVENLLVVFNFCVLFMYFLRIQIWWLLIFF